MMPGMVSIYRPGAAELEQKPVANAAECLRELQRVIEPGYLELVPRWYQTADGAPCRVFCHEEGKIRVPPMPLNELATYEWTRSTLRHYGGRPNDVLVGPVCIVTGDAKFLRSL
jgi:hypothetical protein